MKRYIAERTNKAEIRPKEQSQKTESCPENLSNKIQLKEVHHHRHYHHMRVLGLGSLLILV